MCQTQDMHHTAAIVQERRQRAAEEFEMKIVDSLIQSYNEGSHEANSCQTSPYGPKAIDRNSFKFPSKKMFPNKLIKKISSCERPNFEKESGLRRSSVSDDSVASPLSFLDTHSQHHNITSTPKKESFKINNDGKNYLKKHCDQKFICSNKIVKRQKSNSKIISFDEDVKDGKLHFDEKDQEIGKNQTKLDMQTSTDAMEDSTEPIKKRGAKKIEEKDAERNEENKICMKKCRTPLKWKLMTFLRSKSCIFHRH